MPDDDAVRRRPTRRGRPVVALLVFTVACRAPVARGGGGAPDVREPTARPAGRQVVRVALTRASAPGTLDADAGWQLVATDGRTVLARARAGQSYRITRAGGAVVATGASGPTTSSERTMVARPESPGGSLRWNGRRYRGEIVVTALPAGLLVVNRVGVEDYLRGVVPREVGSLAPRDHAAIEAQAVASRSYALTHLAAAAGDRGYDVTADVSNQVYGGADAERLTSDAAVAATAGEVLLYAGRVVDAAYHSTCGGSTAQPDEVWQARAVPPYLQRVSDRVPGSARSYCDISPRFAWRRTFDGASLDAAIARYLRGYAAVPAGGPGSVRSVRVARVTPSGRVAELSIDTDAGHFTLRGNQIRSVLRTVGGAILNSTYFSVDSMVVGANGHVARLTLRGAGNGHGVGMCQWGAVGRARAGHDYRAILRAYYPGTTLGDAGGGSGR